MPDAAACRCVLPIGALFAVVLWTGNAAYLYLSVSFVQMMKVRLREGGRQGRRVHRWHAVEAAMLVELA